MLQALMSKKVLIRLGVLVGIIVLIAVMVGANGKENAAPTAKASADVTSGVGPLKVKFSSKGSSDPENDKLSYKWSFGDGTTSTQSNPGKTYETEGKYTVVLKVSDKDHATEAKKITITVEAAPVLGAATVVEEEATDETDNVSTTTTKKVATAVLAAATTQTQTTTPVVTPPTTPTEPTEPEVTNLIPNASMVDPYSEDTPLHWIKGSWGDNTTIFGYETTGRTDSSSVSITMSDYLSGDAKWIFEPVTVTGGASYTFSDWYRATVATEIVVEYTHADDTKTYEWLGVIDPATDWTQLTKTLTMPATAKAVSVFHVLNFDGTLQVDDYSLVAN
jgi:PKD repeat protein